MNATTAGIVEGRIEKLRVAVPTIRGNVHMLVDGVPVTGTFSDAADIRTLQDLQRKGTPVRFGVLEHPGEPAHFHWLTTPKAPGIAPRFYVETQRGAWRSIGICLAVAVIALASCFLLGLDSFARALVMVFLVAVALVALMLAGSSVHGVVRNRKDRSAILHGEALYRQYSTTPLKPDAPRAVTPSVETLRASASLVSDEAPEILLVNGTLASLTHETLQTVGSKGPSFGIYRFQIRQQGFALHAGEDLGNVQPFLAEGDRVELAAYAGELPGAGPQRIVYALRNLEDGRVYVCHRRFRGMYTKIAPIGIGLRQRVPLLALLGGLLLATWLFVVGSVYLGGSPGELEEMSEFLSFLVVMLLGVWACFAVPLLYLDTRWRMGRPTRRQRILERIYRAMDLGTPFAPNARIEEV